MAETKLWPHLVENAIAFLTKAIEEFQEQPKYSIINFYTAVELFLKARLLHEHWSLVVSKDPDRQKFEAGDFVSVAFDEACARLQKVAQSPVPDSARKNFEVIRKHRNRMVHFFHEAHRSKDSIESIAREQLRAWSSLNQLLTAQWADAFRPYIAQFKEIERKLRGHREYLRAKYDGLKPSIEEDRSRGANYRICISCEFDAAKTTEILGDLSHSVCLVCDYLSDWFNYECSNCSERSPLEDGGQFACEHCGHKDDTHAIAANIDEFVAHKDNYFEAMVPANCAECGGYHTIVEYKDQYLCVSCFSLNESLQACGWCNEFSNGDMTDSSLTGCCVCDGRLGWDRD